MDFQVFSLINNRLEKRVACFRPIFCNLSEWRSGFTATFCKKVCFCLLFQIPNCNDTFFYHFGCQKKLARYAYIKD
jgi:hypothetical protein